MRHRGSPVCWLWCRVLAARVPRVRQRHRALLRGCGARKTWHRSPGRSQRLRNSDLEAFGTVDGLRGGHRVPSQALLSTSAAEHAACDFQPRVDARPKPKI